MQTKQGIPMPLFDKLKQKKIQNPRAKKAQNCNRKRFWQKYQ